MASTPGIQIGPETRGSLRDFRWWHPDWEKSAPLANNTLGNKIKGDLNMSNRQEAQDHKIATSCELDADIKETLLKHLAEHGPVSLLTSAKFGQYAGCFLEEIERAIASESTAADAVSADDSTGNPDAAASPADDAAESPAAMRVRFQTGRRMISYRQGRV